MAKPKHRPLPRPSDAVQLAAVIGDIATRAVSHEQPTADDVRRVMSMLGKIGGPKGGAARAQALSKKRKVEIARAAALARWGKRGG